MHWKETTMAGADPTVLLDAMGMMLGEFGNIRSPQEVGTVISLMKDAEKLLNRCIFLNILRATIELAADNAVSLETVHQFIKDGGCAILNKWLADAKDLDNLPLILEVLELLEAMPITIETLKQGNIGKLVKQLTKSEEKDIKELASALLDKWMVLVKGKPKKSKKSSEATSEDANSSGSPTMKRLRENSSEGKPTKQPPEKKAKSLSEAKNSVTSVAKPPPKAKVIPALPKPVVMESSGFMNALIQQTVPKIKKKKKPAAPPPSPRDKPSYAGPLEEILQNQSQTHGDEKDKGGKEKEKEKEKEKVEKMDETEKEQESEKGTNDNQESQEVSEQNQAITVEEPTTSEATNDAITGSDAAVNASSNNDQPVETTEAKEKVDEPVDAMETNEVDEVKKEDEQDEPKTKKKKKSIKWAEEEKLLKYHYYEPDEEEKVQHVVNFHDAQHQEAIRERQRVEQAKRLSEDKMMEKQNWYRPKLLEVSELMERGENSQEKFQQKERESKILPDLFFSKSSLPVSAREPEPETNTGPPSQPLVIPHDEKGTVYPPSKGAANMFTPLPAAEPPPTANSTPSLPPALAALLANASKGPGNQANNSGAATNPALANVDVQELLNKLMGSTQNPEERGALEESAQRLQNELAGPRFPSPLMSQQLRLAGRGPGDQGPHPMSQEPPRHGVPDFRARGALLRTPGPPDHVRFPGPHRGGSPRGRFLPPGGPRMRHPMPGPRMPGMGRGGMMNRFQVPDGNRDPGEQYFSDGENPDGPHMMGPRGPRGAMRGGRGRARPMCRHFMSPRGCLRANNCPFLHPGVNGPPV